MNTEKENLEQTPHIVAVLDFLGAAKKMQTSGKSDDFLMQIDEIYSSALEMLTNFTKSENTNYKVKIYSDNIVFAFPIDSQTTLSKLLCVIGFCNAFQIFALEKGLSVRGAITFGDFFSNDVFVYGEALVRAHNLEATQAQYPRIIIDTTINLYELFPSDDEYYRMVIKKDNDDLWYADYFGCLFIEEIKNDLSDHDKFILKIRDGIVENYKNAKDSNFIEKYTWMIKKFNIACKKHPQYTISNPDIAEVSHE